VAAQPQLPLPPERRRSPLTESIIALSGTPDDEPHVDAKLIAIARLSADLVLPIAYASVTAYRKGAYTTVAASSEIAVAVDEAQYADGKGPCLDALTDGSPVAVPSIAATMTWPGFRDTAYRLGLRASLSVPLFAGRGSPVAALNLYSRDLVAMTSLTAAVWAAYDAQPPSNGNLTAGLDPGGSALVDGFSGAFAVRSTIQQAIGVLLAQGYADVDRAYAELRLRSRQPGNSLAGAASSVLADVPSD
jgi:hypothetical protein